jgi:hypothetical protein
MHKLWKMFNQLASSSFITIFNCRYHTSNHLSVCHKPIIRKRRYFPSYFTCICSKCLWCRGKLLISIKRAMNSFRIELLWLVWDQSRSKYYLRTKFQDGIGAGGKGVCGRLMSPAHETQSMREIRFLRGRLPRKGAGLTGMDLKIIWSSVF